MECRIKECGRDIVIRKERLCLKHYKRWRKWGNPEIKYVLNRKNQGQCSVQGCNRNSFCRELCMRHYQSWKRYGDALYSERYLKNRFDNKTEPYFRKNGREIHLQVVENHIGRKLNKGEIVHHINLDKRDNRIENLFICNGKREHNKCHHSLEKIGAELVKQGFIKFKAGNYYT